VVVVLVAIVVVVVVAAAADLQAFDDASPSPYPPSLLIPPNRYREWNMRTPTVTKRTLQVLIFIYLLTWIIDFSMAIVNIPLFTIYHLQGQ